MPWDGINQSFLSVVSKPAQPSIALLYQRLIRLAVQPYKVERVALFLLYWTFIWVAEYRPLYPSYIKILVDRVFR